MRSLFDAAELPARVGVRPPGATSHARHLVVLASSSSGNCSALIHGEGSLRRVTLIDAGLSPRRTNRLLSTLGLSLDHVDDVLFTHLDHDHCHAGWSSPNALPRHATVHVHKRHVNRGMRSGLLTHRTEVFVGDFRLRGGMTVRPVLLSHDDLGAAAFRFDFEGASPEEGLGYTTDLGHVPAGLVELFKGVGVLAIESNYCPVMQHASDRPEFLKARIMGGAGHLSNQQSAAAVRAISPRKHVILLHLSRQCNTPEAALREHDHAGVRVTVALPDQPANAVRIV